MSKIKVSLTKLTSEHSQFCLGIKALLDSGCTPEALQEALELLCDQSDLIHTKTMLLVN